MLFPNSLFFDPQNLPQNYNPVLYRQYHSKLKIQVFLANNLNDCLIYDCKI